MDAAENGQLSCILSLIEAGADMNVMEEEGQKALFKAAIKGHITCVKTLLKAGAFINTGDKTTENTLSAEVGNGTSKKLAAVMLMYAAGERISDLQCEDIDEALKQTQEMVQLKQICRRTIRKYLLQLDPHSHLFHRIPLLGLPSLINQYLLFDASLDENNDSDLDSDSDVGSGFGLYPPLSPDSTSNSDSSSDSDAAMDTNQGSSDSE